MRKKTRKMATIQQVGEIDGRGCDNRMKEHLIAPGSLGNPYRKVLNDMLNCQGQKGWLVAEGY